MHALIAVLALVITIIYLVVESMMKKRDNMDGWKPSKPPIKKKKSGAEKIDKKMKNDVKVIRKVGKTVFFEDSRTGVLALHDNGKITVNMDYKFLLHGLEYRRYGSYFSMSNPTTKDKQIIMDRLFD